METYGLGNKAFTFHPKKQMMGPAEQMLLYFRLSFLVFIEYYLSVRVRAFL